MTKGSYVISEDDNDTPIRRDNSYRSFICALLVFLFICILILLVTIGWGKGSSRNAESEVLERKGYKEYETHKERVPNTSTTLINKITTMTLEENNKLKTKTTISTTTTNYPTESVQKNESERITTEKMTQDEISTTTTNYPTEIVQRNEGKQITTEKMIKGEILTTTINYPTESVQNNEAKQITTEKDNDGKTQDEISTTTTNYPTESVQNNEENQISTERITQVEISTTTINYPTESVQKNEEKYITTEKDNDGATQDEILTTTINYPTESVQNTEEKEITTEKMIQDEISTTTINYLTESIENNEEKQINTERNNDGTTQDEISTTTTNYPTESAQKNEEKHITTEKMTQDEISTTTINYPTESIQKNDAKQITTEKDNDGTIQDEISTTNKNYPTESVQKNEEKHITTEKMTQDEISTTTINYPTESVLKNEAKPTLSAKDTITTTFSEAPVEADSYTRESKIHTKPPQSSVCEKAVCKTAASQFLSAMKHSAVPCEDFYDFACGSFSPSADDSLESIEADVLEKQLSKVQESSPVHFAVFDQFYKSCLSHDDHFDYRRRLDGVEELLAEVGEFMLGNTTTPSDLTDLVSELLLRQSMPLFDVGIDIDEKTSTFFLQLTLPHQSFLRCGIDNWSGLSLQNKRCLKTMRSHIHEYYIDLDNIYELYQNCQHDYSNYLNSVEAVIRELKAFSGISPDTLLTEIKNIRFSIECDVLKKLDALPSSVDIMNNFIDKNYQLKSVSDLQLHYPFFDWKKLFESLTGHEVHEETLVQVYFADYFKKTFASLATINKRILNNAFLAIHAYDLFINTVVPKEQSNRRLFCTKLSKKLMSEAWSQFAQLTYSAEDQNKLNKQADELFQMLKTSFCKSLSDAEWIDSETKTEIVKKCKNLTLAFFAPPDDNELNQTYKNLKVTSNYQTNLIQLLSNYKLRVYSKQGTSFSAKTMFSYFLDPFGAKALTSYASTTIMAPLGLMRRATEGLPNYLILVRAGFTLARQMARHFDPTGIRYRINLESTSKSTYQNLKDTMTTMMQYSSPLVFLGKNISFHLNGSLSNNERIVDNTAFRLVFDLFTPSEGQDLLPWISSEYSREKVFLIAAAQELCEKTTLLDFMLQVFEQRHLPAVLRIKNILGNSERFASIFACAEGSGMTSPIAGLQFPFLTMSEEDFDQEAIYT